MSKYNPSTPDLFQCGGLVNAMHNACIATLRCYVKDSDSPLGLSEVTLYGFEVAGATMYARVIQELGLIITSTDCEVAAAHTSGQSVVNIQTAIGLALCSVGFTDKLLKELDFMQVSHEKLWTTSDADLVLEVLPFLRYSTLDNQSGLTLDATIELQAWIHTLDVYWQTAGSTNQIHMPTLLRDVRRERKEHGKSLHRVATTGGMYSRVDDTLHAAPRPSGLYTRSVRCVVGGASYVAYRKGNCCKMLHLGDKPRSISKATIEGLGVILAAKWGVDSGFAGTKYCKLDYLIHHYAPALLVMILTDAKGTAWIVAKHRENWAASRMSAKSRATVVQIYT